MLLHSSVFSGLLAAVVAAGDVPPARGTAGFDHAYLVLDCVIKEGGKQLATVMAAPQQDRVRGGGTASRNSLRGLAVLPG